MKPKNTSELTALLTYGAYRLSLLSLRATTMAGSGHLTSSLSAAEIISALFLAGIQKGDRFILSKGHAAPVLYAIYHELGLLTTEELLTLRKFESRLEGHPSPRWPFVRAATGSLGQGLALGLGYLKAVEDPHARMFVLLGDAELTEGSNWEAAFCAAYANERRLIAIVDANGRGQSHISPLTSSRIAAQFQAWCWQVYEVDGHDVEALCAAYEAARLSHAPVCIVARTHKGNGIAMIEDRDGWHGKAVPTKDEPMYELALATSYPIAQHEPTGYRTLCAQRSSLYTDWWPASHELTAKPRSFTPPAELATRRAIGEALVAYGDDPNIFVLDGEVKNSTYTEIFEANYPQRFVEAFVAEQTMIGMASGIACAGKIPVAATFASFLTRAHDQIRMAAISRLPLRIIGTHAGVSIGEDGPSQMGLEDIALFRTLPDAVVLQPCDAVSADRLTLCMLERTEGITYLRALRGATPTIYSPKEKFEIGGAQLLRSSPQDAVLIVASGVTVHEALRAYEQLLKQNIRARVIDCYSIQPLPVQRIRESLEEVGGKLIVAEDHYAAGGLGEAVAAACASHITKFAHCAVNKIPMSGTPELLRAWAGIDAAGIVKAASNL